MRELMTYLPEWYEASREVQTTQAAFQPEVAALWDARADLLAQLDPWTATWGIDLWEDALGILAAAGLALEARRAAVAAKLRGRETTTPELIRENRETILRVPVTVTEVYEGYLVYISFDAQGQLPAGMDALTQQLDQIMPAHLVWEFLIRITPTLYVGAGLSTYHITYLPILGG